MQDTVRIPSIEVAVAQPSSEELARLAAAAWLPPLGPYASFGRRWTVQTDDDALTALLDDLYADLLESEPPPKASMPARFRVLSPTDTERGVVLRDAERLGRGHRPATALNSLVWGINRWVLDVASREHLLLHAGGVVREDGVAVLLPAPSESGKSTLTMGLLDRGLAYLSDEAVSVRPDGTVTGYAKPVSIDRGAWEALGHHRPQLPADQARFLERQWHVRASSCASVAHTARLGAMVFPHYDALATTKLTRISPSHALRLAGNSTFAPGDGERVELSQVQGLANALTGLPAYSLVTSQLDDACKCILGLLEKNLLPS